MWILFLVTVGVLVVVLVTVIEAGEAAAIENGATA